MHVANLLAAAERSFRCGEVIDAERGDVEGALRSLQIATRRAGASREAWNCLGACPRKKGLHREAARVPYLHADRHHAQVWRDRMDPSGERMGVGEDLRSDDERWLHTASGGMRFLGDRIEDFHDAAAIVANLDLVISVDTALAHLAGALGKPVWILLPWSADWRWLAEGERTPWYPSARLFRQERAGDWSGVMDAVRGALATWGPGACA